MKKLFVSVPMRGRTDAEIKDTICKMKKIAEIYEGEELELIPSYTKYAPPDGTHTSVYYLSKSIEKLSHADVFIGISEEHYFPGCEIEMHIAQRYGIKTYRVDAERLISNWQSLIDSQPKCYNVCNICDESYITDSEATCNCVEVNA